MLNGGRIADFEDSVNTLCANGKMTRGFAIHQQRKNKNTTEIERASEMVLRSRAPLKAPDNAQIKRNTATHRQQSQFKVYGKRKEEYPQREFTNSNAFK